MAQAPRDENSITVALAYDGITTKPLKVDATTGRLLIQIDATNGSSPIAAGPVPRDENHIPVAAVKDDNGDIRPLHIDSTSGLLSVHLLTE